MSEAVGYFQDAG